MNPDKRRLDLTLQHGGSAPFDVAMWTRKDNPSGKLYAIIERDNGIVRFGPFITGPREPIADVTLTEEEFLANFTSVGVMKFGPEPEIKQ